MLLACATQSFHANAVCSCPEQLPDVIMTLAGKELFMTAAL